MHVNAKGPRMFAQRAFPFRSSLELVTQCELHYARVGEQSTVHAKGAGGDVGCNRLDIESLQVGHVENFPTEQQGVRLPKWQLPTLAESEVQTGKARASHRISGATLTGKV